MHAAALDPTPRHVNHRNTVDPVTAVREYRAAEKALAALRGFEGTSVHTAAVEVVERLGGTEVAFAVPCLLGCGQVGEHRDTVANAADYRYSPRGICGACASIC